MSVNFYYDNVLFFYTDSYMYILTSYNDMYIITNDHLFLAVLYFLFPLIFCVDIIKKNCKKKKRKKEVTNYI